MKKLEILVLKSAIADAFASLSLADKSKLSEHEIINLSFCLRVLNERLNDEFEKAD